VTPACSAQEADVPAPQHLRALQRANQIRLARAEIKRRIATGELTVVEVLVSGAQEIETMEIAELLTSQRRWGHTRARRFLAAIPMTESKTIGSMTERQLSTLASMLSAYAPRTSRLVAAQTAA
jgi:ferritin-like metal-binding protein YciE